MNKLNWQLLHSFQNRSIAATIFLQFRKFGCHKIRAENKNLNPLEWYTISYHKSKHVSHGLKTRVRKGMGFWSSMPAFCLRHPHKTIVRSICSQCPQIFTHLWQHSYKLRGNSFLTEDFSRPHSG